MKRCMGRGGALRAVVDTNIFVSGLITADGIPYQLLEGWRAGAFVLLVAPPQREELERVLKRPIFPQRYGLTEERIDYWLLLVAALGLSVRVRRRLPVHARDRRDDHILAAALGGHADYLVTGDEDILSLDAHPRLKSLRIVRVTEFLELLSSQTN